MQTKEQDRLEFLDGIRGVACLYVVIGHLFLAFNISHLGLLHDAFPKFASVYSNLFILLFRYGYYAVIVFLVLSGYCLILPIARKAHPQLRIDIGLFLKRRAKRILPPYYACLLLSLLRYVLIPPLEVNNVWLWDQNLPMTGWVNWLSHLTLTHNWTEHFRSINTVTWSMSVEWQAYFLLPFLFLPLLRRVPVYVFVLITMVLGLGLALAIHPYFPNVTAQFSAFFTMGCAAGFLGNHPPTQSALVRLRKPLERLFLVLSVVIPAVFLIQAAKSLHRIAALKWISVNISEGMAVEYLVALWAGALLVCLTQNSGWVSTWPSLFVNLKKLFSSKVLVGVGGFSYSLYLSHSSTVAIMDLVSRKLGFSPTTHMIWLFVCGFPLTILFGWLFYRAFEKPFLNKPVRS